MRPTPTDSNNELLQRGVAEIIDPKHIDQRLRRGQPLRIKYGIDPTSHNIHLGHAVPLRKLREWQDAGHQAVVIIGDYTAQVGDPSGRDKQRVALTAEMVERFASTYVDQIGTILDIRRTEIRHNSEWYGRFTPADFLQLIRQASVQQLLAHETFHQRLKSDKPLNLLELMYPLLQGYDSVAVEADVELGGVDQKFNLLMGRTIQAAYEQEPQDVMLMPYLTGVDGKAKMSKTADNAIFLADTATDMYGKIMSIPDKLIGQYFELATTLSGSELDAILKTVKKKGANHRDLKAQLAQTIVTLYHGAPAGEQAGFEFTKVFRKKEAPSTMPVITVRPGEHALMNILISHQLVASRSEARRLIEQGGVKINQKTVTDWEATIQIDVDTTLQIGKRKFYKLTTSPS